MRYKVYICGPTECPIDPHFIHETWPFGCVPKDFKYQTGTSRSRHQSPFEFPGFGVRHLWNGGCDAAGIFPHDLAERRWPGPPLPLARRGRNHGPLRITVS